ncbi:MAG TPA: OmpH family outer membrane protein [Thiobacillaceae bacterium]|nr:OmpH family outer membrane protein [Thiobacillaceae bacterium]HNA82018.1 OmpH family outer membrane protein [Thiobacillaceae bacterium]HNF89021.1 OmpH family outer membrane protein [Thiobacillaceae bacterium]HNH89187.1 OmpH family outer membrane protein [Thiobacillaceae bacterium]HNI08179.1 OmpH family outer membrane protein [Thiobacillaceae bacterium]
MKRFLLLLCCIALPAAAQTADLKIGFVNTEKVFRDSQLAIKAQKKLEKEFQNRDQDIQKMVKQAKDLQSMLEKEGLTMSEADRNKKQKDLANLTRDIQHAQREFREDLNQRKNEEFTTVQDRARKAIIEIAEKEKFDLVLENVVYASPRVDITERVLKALER